MAKPRSARTVQALRERARQHERDQAQRQAARQEARVAAREAAQREPTAAPRRPLPARDVAAGHRSTPRPLAAQRPGRDKPVLKPPTPRQAPAPERPATIPLREQLKRPGRTPPAARSPAPARADKPRAGDETRPRHRPPLAARPSIDTRAALATRPLRASPPALRPAPRPVRATSHKPDATPAPRSAAARLPAAKGLGRDSGPAWLPWLTVRAGALYDSAGRVVRLIGLRVEGLPAGPRDAAPTTLLSAVPEGRRCLALPLQTLADMKPAALAGLDAAVAAHARAGAYTLLRIEPRLWLQDHHLQLARRYAGQPAVLFALLGREDLADALTKAALAMRDVHAGACLWLPLAAARSAFAALPDPRIGLLWNAADPQGPRPPALTGCLRAPVLLDGWQPNTLHPLADERLMRLCREAGIGWLACRPDQPRGRLALQRAALLSLPDDNPTEPLPLAA